MKPSRTQTTLVSLSVSVLVVTFGCKAKEVAQGTSVKETASASEPEPRVVSDAAAEQALNPGHEKPYSGPVGHIKGTVHASGDPPSVRADVLAKIPSNTCADARAFYGKLFREGPNRELGDVLVAVTGYKGYLPPPDSTKKVVIRGCAFDSRTIALTFGQTISVFNRGGETFIPELRGARSAALIVAVPGGDPVKLYPDRVGQYELVDRSREFARADVYVLKYPTVSVTGIDGAFSITGIPPGEVLVSALLPATGQTAQRHATVVAGETTTVDFVLPWSAPAETPPPKSSGH